MRNSDLGIGSLHGMCLAELLAGCPEVWPAFLSCWSFESPYERNARGYDFTESQEFQGRVAGVAFTLENPSTVIY